MKRIFAAGSGVLLLMAVAFGAGASWRHRAAAAASEASVLYYACPMHPQYHRQAPGDCSSCGMGLEPVRASATPAAGPAGAPGRGRPGTVRVSAERQQAVGVRLGVADRVAGRRTFRTTGRVAPDENATYPIVAGASGWIRSAGQATTGSLVKRNERLASFYSPEFAAVLQSYYSGLETFDRAANRQLVDFNKSRLVEGVQRFADTLRNMGVSETQLQEMRSSREFVQDIYLTSPVHGFVLQRNVSAGLRFDRGFEFYRIADLRKVWILADVFQHQRSFVRPGVTAQVTGAQRTSPFTAVVSDTEPVFDEATLTLTVRLEAANPDFTLKPGMFVDVELPIELQPALAVPADAIVDSGLRKTVFVDLGEGFFEPRQVETGWRIDDQVEITRGLMAGERIALSGTFLIDSESRMNTAAEGAATAEDPVCGMQVHAKDAKASGRAAAHAQQTYYFCSDGCRTTFEASPAAYLDRRRR